MRNIFLFTELCFSCHKVLEPKGLNLIHIITSPDKDIFKVILNAFVGIVAIQIGLTDVLHELGLKPDGIIGKIILIELSQDFCSLLNNIAMNTTSLVKIKQLTASKI